jgi:hypothetical protein
MLVSVFRVFLVKYSPYSAVFVGCYALVHGIYGGCPVLEFENVFNRYLGLPESMVGDVYILFGDWGYLIRFVIALAGLGLIYNAYRVWNQAEQPFVIENIWMKPRKLTHLEAN